MDVKRGVYETNNQLKNPTFKYEQEGRFCLGVAKIESKYGTIIGKRCPVFRKNILDRNKDNNSTYFTFSILFTKYKREEVEIRHVPYCYNKN